MSQRHSDVVAAVCDRMLDGTEATARGPLNPRMQIIDCSSGLVGRIGGSRMDCAGLADLMTACYHLGREQALQRVAIGLDGVAMETPEPASAKGLSKDGGLIRPDRVAEIRTYERLDGYDNVPADDDGICLGDEPKPPHDPGCYRPDGRLGPCSHDYPPPSGAQGRTRAERLAEVDPKEWTK